MSYTENSFKGRLCRSDVSENSKEAEKRGELARFPSSIFLIMLIVNEYTQLTGIGRAPHKDKRDESDSDSHKHDMQYIVHRQFTFQTSISPSSPLPVFACLVIHENRCPASKRQMRVLVVRKQPSGARLRITASSLKYAEDRKA